MYLKLSNLEFPCVPNTQTVICLLGNGRYLKWERHVRILGGCPVGEVDHPNLESGVFRLGSQVTVGINGWIFVCLRLILAKEIVFEFFALLLTRRAWAGRGELERDRWKQGQAYVGKPIA